MHAPHRGPAAHLAAVPLGALAAGAVGSVALDAAVERHGPPHLVAHALLDWGAHVAVTAIVLRVLPRQAGAYAEPALAASVLIDLDHIPIAAAMLRGDDGLPRPRPHTFATPALLALFGSVLRGRARTIALGAALGTTAHLARDLFNGPGVAVGWPLHERHVRLPVALQGVALAGLVALAARRRDP
jgi:hypothetical protein